MAVNPTPDASVGIWQATKDALGLFGPTNKAEGFDENSVPTPVEEYESSLTEKEIIELIREWRRTYSVYFRTIDESQKLAFNYWVGRHRQDDGEPTTKSYQNQVDNLIFEAMETFLPIATRANPEPLVTADPSDDGQKLANDIQIALAHEADVQKLRRKLAKMTRQWGLYRLGCLKVTWDVKTKSIKTDVISVKKMLFDKDGYIDEGGHFVGTYVAEKKRISAAKLIEMFPKHRQYLEEQCQHKMGTMMDYIEWWYQGTDVFYTYEDRVLGKYKNPNWNYDGEITQTDPETGEPVTSFIQGSNHLKEPSYPYVFMAVFNTGSQPHDETSLILQNIPIQDRINRRYRQIDHNVKRMNNGLVVSGTSFTEEQASQAASALARGMAIRVPTGDVRTAVQTFPAVGLPKDVFEALQDDRNELRNIFGTSGSTPQGTEQQDTVRGKILVTQMDSSRIGGGITECIEQVADSIYNLWVQFMFVYYDDEHFITADGSVNGAEMIVMKNSRFIGMKTLTITVKEGSLIPKDPLTQRNEAMDLWSAGAIDPASLFKKLDFPNPSEATQQLILWQMFQKGQVPPQAYLPSFSVAPGGPQGMPGAMPAEPGVGGPAVNPINGPDIGQQGPPQASGGAIQQQSKQLLNAVPIR